MRALTICLLGLLTVVIVTSSLVAAPVNGIGIDLFTLDDDKDRDDTIRIILLYRGQPVRSQDVGRGQVWRDDSHRRFHFSLPRTYDSRDLRISIQKFGDDGEWRMRLQCVGVQGNGAEVVVLPTTKKYEFKKNTIGYWQFSR